MKRKYALNRNELRDIRGGELPKLYIDGNESYYISKPHRDSTNKPKFHHYLDVDKDGKDDFAVYQWIPTAG